MKKWQKEEQKAKGQSGYEALINEETRWNDKPRHRNKPKSMRDKHRGAITRREVVITHDED